MAYRRSQDIEGAAKSILARLEAGKLDRAERELGLALRLYGEDGALLALKDQARRCQRRSEIDRLVAIAEEPGRATKMLLPASRRLSSSTRATRRSKPNAPAMVTARARQLRGRACAGDRRGPRTDRRPDRCRRYRAGARENRRCRCRPRRFPGGAWSEVSASISALSLFRSIPSPKYSPGFCCGSRCTALSGVFGLRGARRTVKYASAPLRPKAPLRTAPRDPRDEPW